MLSKTTSSGALEAFDRMEDKILKMESEAEVIILTRQRRLQKKQNFMLRGERNHASMCPEVRGGNVSDPGAPHAQRSNHPSYVGVGVGVVGRRRRRTRRRRLRTRRRLRRRRLRLRLRAIHNRPRHTQRRSRAVASRSRSSGGRVAPAPGEAAPLPRSPVPRSPGHLALRDGAHHRR